MLHEIVHCHIRFGMQAAIVRHVWITTVLHDGLILRPVNRQHFLRWQEEYSLIKHTKLLRWTEEEWLDQGYVLSPDHRPCFNNRQGDMYNAALIPYPKDYQGGT